MRNFVIINGVNSNTINGLGINELPPITKPEMRNIREEIDGRDGDIITELGYSAYDKTITIGLFGTGYDINDIVAFFNGEGTIVFSNEDDKYYKYKILNQIDYESLQKFRNASITFHCQPFKYPLSETPLEIEYDYIEDEDETLTLNNTGNATMKLDLKGNTSQSGTPTPTSPIPVSVVSGDNDVVVCGKNLLNLEDGTFTDGANLTIKIENQKVILNGTTSANYLWLNLTKKDYRYGTPNTTNKPNWFTGTLITAGQYIGSISENVGTFNVFQSDGTIKGVNYITSTANICSVGLYIETSGTTFNNKEITLQIEKGTATTYQPYQSQTYEVDLPVENLLDNSKTSSTSGVLTTTYLGGTRYRIQGLTTGNKVFMTGLGIPSDTYTLSITLVSGSYSGGNLVIQDQSNTTIGEVTIGALGTKVTKTVTGTVGRLILWNTSTFDGTFDIQIEPGTKANSYSPFGQTPIKMRGIGTYEDYFVRNSGKNLIQLTNQDFSIGDLHYSVDGGVLQATGSRNPEVQRTNSSFKNNFKMTLQAGTYKLNFSESGTKTGTLNYYIMKYSDDSEIKRIQTTYDTFTLTEETEIYLGIYSYQLAITGTLDIRIMLCKDDGTTPIFEPFGSNKWCKYNAIGKVVLDGTQTISSVNTSLTNTTRVQLNGALPENCRAYADNVLSKSNRLSYNNNWSKDEEGFFFDDNQKNVIFRINKATIGTTQGQVNTWLGSNNLIIYYALGTPYLSLIEDTNLIEQLDNLENAMSYEGQTNISQVNNDKAFIISAKALEKGTNEVVVNNIGNIYSKPLIALEGNGNVDIYLDNTQILKANVEDKMNIDIAQLEAYNPDTMTLLNRQVIGNYNSMTLQPGNNTIRIDGALDKATITNYTRYL